MGILRPQDVERRMGAPPRPRGPADPTVAEQLSAQVIQWARCPFSSGLQAPVCTKPMLLRNNAGSKSPTSLPAG